MPTVCTLMYQFNEASFKEEFYVKLKNLSGVICDEKMIKIICIIDLLNQEIFCLLYCNFKAYFWQYLM